MMRRWTCLLALCMTALAAPAWGAMQDMDFFALCSFASAREIKAALASGADPNARFFFGSFTALMSAARDNADPEVISVLVEAGAYVDARTPDKETALMFAAEKNVPAVVAALLKAGADINARDGKGMTALMRAAKNNHHHGVIIALIQAGAELDARDNEGKTALMWASYDNHRNKNPQVLIALLDAGADVTIEDKNGMWAVGHTKANRSLRRSEAMRRLCLMPPIGNWVFIELCKFGSADDIRTAIQRGANVNAIYEQNTALMAAARENPHPEVINVLVNAGVYVNAEIYYNHESALTIAAKNNPNPAVLSALLDAGADVKKYGVLALKYAQKNKHLKGSDVLKRLTKEAPMSPEDFFKLCASGTAAQIRAAIKKGAKVNVKVSPRDETPLMSAATSNPDSDVIMALAEAGADVNALDRGKGTALRYAAAENPFPEVIKALIKAGAKVNAKNGFGVTALTAAASHSMNPEIIDVLLDAGADVNIWATDVVGKRAINYACSNKYLRGSKALGRLAKLSGTDLSDKDRKAEKLSDEEFLRVCTFAAPEQLSAAIQAGANVKLKSDWTSLMAAARFNHNAEFIALLIQAGVVVNARGKGGATALMIASGMNTLAVVEALIKAGADVNAKADGGVTALMAAAGANPDPRVIVALLNADADVNAKYKDGKRAIDYAKENKKLQGTDALRRLEIASGLAPQTKVPASGPVAQDPQTASQAPTKDSSDTSRRPDPASSDLSVSAGPTGEGAGAASADRSSSAQVEVNEEGATHMIGPDVSADVEEPASAVPESGDIEAAVPARASSPQVTVKLNDDEFLELCASAPSAEVEAAVEAGANVHAKDWFDVTPLMKAAEGNADPGAVAVLMRAGAKVDAKDKSGKTALMYAASSNPALEVILALTEAGADVEAKGNDGRTVLMLAARLNPEPKVITALIKAGADVDAKMDNGWTPLI